MLFLQFYEICLSTLLPVPAACWGLSLEEVAFFLSSPVSSLVGYFEMGDEVYEALQTWLF